MTALKEKPSIARRLDRLSGSKVRRYGVVERILEFITLEKAWDTILEDINNDVITAGKPLHTVRLLKKIRTATIFTAISFIPLSIILMAQISPLFVSINLVWILLFAFPKLQLAQLSQDRRQRVEEELPFFVMISSVLQSVGINLYESFQYFRQSKIFSANSREAILLARNVHFFGMSQIEALEEMGRTHKSQPFSNLLLGYTSIWRSGGDLANYLENNAEEFFVTLKEKYQSYASSVGNVAELLVTLLVILPIMIMIVSFVMPGSSMAQMAMLATVGLPLFAMVIGVIISKIQPNSFNVIGLGEKQLVALFSIGLASTFLLYFVAGQEIWLAITTGFMPPSLLAAVIGGRQSREISKLEQALPQFLRDITEYKKIGYDVLLAIGKLSRERSYNSVFDEKLREFVMLLEHGKTPVEGAVNVQFRSWMTKISFFMLAYIAELGGGSPRVLETINRFITNSRHAIREGKSSITVMTLLVFVSPIIMVFTAGTIQGMLGALDVGELVSQDMTGPIDTAIGGTSGLTANLLNVITVTPEFLSTIKTLIVTSSILSAFVIGKAIDFTFYNPWRVVVIGLIAISSIMGMDYFLSQENGLQEVLLRGIGFGS